MIPHDFEKDVLQPYLKEVAATHPLSAEEEIVLARRIRKGDMAARTKLVEANLRFVIWIAQRYQNHGMSLEDLISAGNLGLITAAERFDETKGFKFISYAVWWVRQAIHQTLKEHARLVRLPVNRIDLLQRIFQYVKSQQHHPDEEEIASELGISVEMVKDTLVKGQHILSLDATFGDGERSLMEVMADEMQESPDAFLMKDSLREEIDTALEGLKAREREIIKLYFGLDGLQRMNLEQIGCKFGLTRERIRQIKERALRKLRHPKRAQKLLSYYAEEV